ncbi:MAG: 5-dehydro-2-deoxygluconokinase [Candidatus Dormibacteraceae bacterium]
MTPVEVPVAQPPHLEIVTMGRVGVDLYPQQLDTPLAEVRSFTRSLGGSPTNVAVGAARLGHRAAIITKVGADPFGAYVRSAIAGFGVWPGWVGTDPDLHTPLAFAEIHPPDRFPLLFYREPSAPDLNLRPGDFDLPAVTQAPLFWATGTGLSAEPSRSTTLQALGARSRLTTVFDIDYRPSLWSNESAAEAARWAREAARLATVVVANEEEARLLTEEAETVPALGAILDLGPRVAIIKRGTEGVIASAADGPTIEVRPIAVRTLCGLGAGDAFGAGLSHGLLRGWSLEESLRFANGAGALVASRLHCAEAMPTVAEVEELLSRE